MPSRAICLFSASSAVKLFYLKEALNKSEIPQVIKRAHLTERPHDNHSGGVDGTRTRDPLRDRQVF